MILRKILIISFILCVCIIRSQTVSATYKTNELLKRIQSKDSVYVLNFWATWCKPCIQELPAFDSLTFLTKNTNTKVLLVCLDFSDELQSKVIPFLKKNKIQSECVLLNEINGNDYIDKISKEWSGAIPATYFQFGDKTTLIEKKMKLVELQEIVQKLSGE